MADEVKKLSIGTKELVLSMNDILKKMYCLTEDANDEIDIIVSKFNELKKITY